MSWAFQFCSSTARASAKRSRLECQAASRLKVTTAERRQHDHGQTRGRELRGSGGLAAVGAQAGRLYTRTEGAVTRGLQKFLRCPRPAYPPESRSRGWGDRPWPLCPWRLPRRPYQASIARPIEGRYVYRSAIDWRPTWTNPQTGTSVPRNHSQPDAKRKACVCEQTRRRGSRQQPGPTKRSHANRPRPRCGKTAIGPPARRSPAGNGPR